MSDLDFIQEYRKLKTLTEICRKFNCDRSNLIRGLDKKNENSVAKICKCEIIRLYNMLLLGENYETDTL